MVIRAPISVAIAAGAVLIGILFPMPALEIGKTFLSSLIDFHTVNLLVVVYLITLLGRMMKETGALGRFARGAEYVLRGSRVGLISTPMFVGLLPMPGGALLTAPMVAEQAKPHQITPGLLTYLNYWFRHIWEYFWPLYPPIIIGMAILEIPYRHFLVNQSFMTLVAISVGTVVLFGFVKRRQTRPERIGGKTRLAFKDIIYGTFPVLSIMLLIAIQQLLPQGSRVGQIGSQIPLSGLMLLVVVLAWIAYRLPFRASGRLLLRSLDWRVLTLLVAVMFFRQMLTSSTALDGFGEILKTSSSALIILLVMLLPFLVGLLVGLNQAYVAVTFPLLAPFMANEPGLILLAFVFGFSGCLL
jgi:integral membrane protein (TIGR00529 family)